MHQVFLLCFGPQWSIFPTCAPQLARIDEPWNTDHFRYGTETFEKRVPLM